MQLKTIILLTPSPDILDVTDRCKNAGCRIKGNSTHNKRAFNNLSSFPRVSFMQWCDSTSRFCLKDPEKLKPKIHFSNTHTIQPWENTPERTVHSRGHHRGCLSDAPLSDGLTTARFRGPAAEATVSLLGRKILGVPSPNYQKYRDQILIVLWYNQTSVT